MKKEKGKGSEDLRLALALPIRSCVHDITKIINKRLHNTDVTQFFNGPLHQKQYPVCLQQRLSLNKIPSRKAITTMHVTVFTNESHYIRQHMSTAHKIQSSLKKEHTHCLNVDLALRE